MPKSLITDHLLLAFVNIYSLYLKTQNYHWNITGPHFLELHKLLEEQYKDLSEALDDLAEHIRTYGIKVPATFNKFIEVNILAEPDEQADYKTMLIHLLEDNKSLYQILSDCIKLAEESRNHTTADLLVQRLATHEKNIWILNSILN